MKGLALACRLPPCSAGIPATTHIPTRCSAHLYVQSAAPIASPQFWTTSAVTHDLAAAASEVMDGGRDGHLAQAEAQFATTAPSRGSEVLIGWGVSGEQNMSNHGYHDLSVDVSAL